MLFAGVAASAAELEGGARYLIQSTSQVTVSLPVSGAGGQHLYRNAEGQWVPLPEVKEGPEGTVTFTLSPDQLTAGGTVVLIGKPDWLVAEDSTPPQVERITIDGKKVAPATEIDLGWLDTAPKTFDLLVADAQNPLDPASVGATVNGVDVPVGSPGLRFYQDPANPKRGRIVCSLSRLKGWQSEGAARVVIRCDDFAPDFAHCTTTCTFTATQPPQVDLGQPAATTPEGVQIFVDSIFSGYENVECLLDDQLQTPGTTTVGSTWASEETGVAHWLCLVFPQPRQVSGLEISWANYQNTFWTSSRYALMTWDSQKWVRVLKVQDNLEAQTSVHEFPATTTDRVLVWVPAGGNHLQRPNITWMTEVKVRP
jgi:hypothetical protein